MHAIMIFEECILWAKFYQKDWSIWSSEVWSVKDRWKLVIAVSSSHATSVYNKYKGGVDQVRRTYGFDRKFRHCWLGPFFQFFFLNYAINNAYFLYKHNCKWTQ